MTKWDTQILGDEGAALAGALAPSSRSGTRRREPAILVFSQRPAARISPADAMEPDEGFESLGSIAVRLLAEWSKPRMRLLAPPQGGGKGDASA